MAILEFLSNFISKKEPVNVKPLEVNLIRYIRFRDRLTGKIDSNSGIALDICLDYHNRKINVNGIAICSEKDNFSRKAARELLKRDIPQNKFSIEMGIGGIPKHGVVFEIIYTLCERKRCSNLSAGEKQIVNTILKMKRKELWATIYD